MRALILCLAILPVQAAAGDAWGTFATRCLVHLEAVGPADVSGLGQGKVGAADQEGRAYRIDDARATLFAVDGTPEIQAVCAVQLDADAPEAMKTALLDAFADWAQGAVAAGRYGYWNPPINDITFAWMLNSHEIREPVLQVSLWQKGGAGPWVAMAEETDRES